MKNNTLLALINSLGGNIIENDFEDINENLPLHEQLTLLDEDMLMIEFDDDFILSVGWYGNSQKPHDYEAYKSTGNFVVCVVHNYDWENVLQASACNTIEELKTAIQNAYAFITADNKVHHPMGSHNSSKYKPEIDIQELECHAWYHGQQVTNGKNWRVFKADMVIGATSGQETSYVLIKCRNNTIHGHPILECEYQALAQPAD